MRDPDGVRFLQECLPRLHLHWPGFRKVRRQVYKRIDRRLSELGLADLDQYRGYLATHPDEWPVLDAVCWISISRFYRDRGVFQFLEQEVFPQLVGQGIGREAGMLQCWSLGCAAGEEPYTLAILWKLGLQARFPATHMRILATDVDPHAIERARSACYPPSSLKELPVSWRDEAFSPTAEGWCVKPAFRDLVAFAIQDVREGAPEGPFDLILCRYLIFTYFDEALQRALLRTLLARLVPRGVLVIGNGESLPEGEQGIEPWSAKPGVYRKTGDQPAPPGRA